MFLIITRKSVIHTKHRIGVCGKRTLYIRSSQPILSGRNSHSHIITIYLSLRIESGIAIRSWEILQKFNFFVSVNHESGFFILIQCLIANGANREIIISGIDIKHFNRITISPSYHISPRYISPVFRLRLGNGGLESQCAVGGFFFLARCEGKSNKGAQAQHSYYFFHFSRILISYTSFSIPTTRLVCKLQTSSIEVSCLHRRAQHALQFHFDELGFRSHIHFKCFFHLCLNLIINN